jgi:glycosyltransferase involved in cell wall biosynthesis
LQSGDRRRGILQLSTSDREGGAERVAWNLFQAYRARGHASWLAVGKKRSDDADVFSIVRPPIWAKWCGTMEERLSPWDGQMGGVKALRRALHLLSDVQGVRSRRRGTEDFNYFGSRSLLSLPPLRPDIVHAHNLHGGYFDLRVLPQLSHRVPVMLTLHDAWLLSGHCAHSFGCERWRTGCGQCPALGTAPAIRRDATAFNWRRKRDIFARSRFYVATPCRWLLDRVGQSILAPAVIEGRVIPNGVDIQVFRPGDRLAARQALGIPANVPVLLFAANGIQLNTFKDYATLRGAMVALGESSTNDILFLALGETGPDERIGKVLIRFVAPVAEPGLVAGYYQAADLYLHAARADTFPNTILEALACGTPVIATAIGGIPEQVADGETGLLVPPGDQVAMAQAISRLLADPGWRARMGAAAASAALRDFPLALQVDRYLDWYQAIGEH